MRSSDAEAERAARRDQFSAISRPVARRGPGAREPLARRVLGLDAKFLGAIGFVGEAEVRIFRDRYAGRHRENEILSLVDRKLVDVARRRVKPGHLIHLQPGIVGMADHEKGLVRRLWGDRQDAELHLAK